MPFARKPRPALAACLAVLLCAASEAALAQLGGTVSLQSDARYRGVSYSNERPQAQLTLSYDVSDGWYGGGLLSQARFTGSRPGAYLQAYAGRVFGLMAGVDAEAGLSFNHFDAVSRYDYAEAYVGLLGQRWNARLHVSNDYYGSGQRSVYGELNMNWPFTSSMQAIAHAGVLHAFDAPAWNPQGSTRYDARAGVAWRQGPWELQLAWVGASPGGPYIWVDDRRRATAVLGLSAAF